MITADDVQVVIPSRRRVADATHCVTLWPQANVSVCVDESEAEDYKDVGARIVTHPRVNGLGQLRQWILDHYDAKVIVQCNDDLKCLRCLIGKRTRKITEPEAMMAVMLNSANACEEIGISLFSFSPTLVPFRLDPFKPFLFNRIEGALFGMVGRGLRFDPNVRNHDDVALSLEALLKERIVWQDARFGAEHNFFTRSGGNSVSRGTMLAEREYLVQKWGQYIGISERGKDISKSAGVPALSLMVCVQRQQGVDI